MTATTYTDQRDYIKFNSKSKDTSCGCGESQCGCNKQDCGCCPNGLVGVYDDKSQFVACLTPNDAELYKKNSLVCQDGYVKLYNNITGEFLGCVSEDKFAELNTSVNGEIDATGVLIAGPDSVDVDGEIELYAVFDPTNTTDQRVTWETSDATIATVDTTGVVTGVAEGSTTITVKSVRDVTISDTKLISVTNNS